MMASAGMSASPLKQMRYSPQPQIAGTIVLLAVGCYGAIFPFYGGSATTLAVFVISSTLLFGFAVVLRPSFFVILLAAFLTLGFLLKAVTHFAFGSQLVEPVGDFSGSAAQWDLALKF